MTFKISDKIYKGLKLFSPPVQTGDKGNYEIGGFSEVNDIGKYFKTKIEILSINVLKELSTEELKIMRNEIYARYHYLFKTQKMSDYFNKQKWYSGYNKNIDLFLTEIEKENTKRIKEVEKIKSNK